MISHRVDSDVAGGDFTSSSIIAVHEQKLSIVPTKFVTTNTPPITTNERHNYLHTTTTVNALRLLVIFKPNSTYSFREYSRYLEKKSVLKSAMIGHF